MPAYMMILRKEGVDPGSQLPSIEYWLYPYIVIAHEEKPKSLFNPLKIDSRLKQHAQFLFDSKLPKGSVVGNTAILFEMDLVNNHLKDLKSFNELIAQIQQMAAKRVQQQLRRNCWKATAPQFRCFAVYHQIGLSYFEIVKATKVQHPDLKELKSHLQSIVSQYPRECIMHSPKYQECLLPGERASLNKYYTALGRQNAGFSASAAKQGNEDNAVTTDDDPCLIM